ncbi:MAG: ATP--guanido phosphotransferase, partial [Planctomycetia bacterium]
MDLRDLVSRTGEWLRGTGSDSDIVISSRLRLARNLADFPFCGRANEHEKREIERLLRARALEIVSDPPLEYVDISGLGALDRKFLVERQLISRELSEADGPRGCTVSQREDVSLMFNEEDHLRIQVIRGGYSIRECGDYCDRLDD